MSGTLYIVATPIGNLGDITQRAINTLKEVDFIFCEDTRVTKKLLTHFGINSPVDSYHQHSSMVKSKKILEILQNGQSVALVTDAGTPGVSDPGNELVDYIRKNLSSVSIVPVPGVTALASALSVSGFPTDKFVFLGFPPHKNKRKKFFEEVGSTKYTVVLYESSHRIQKAIKDLSEVLDTDAEIFIARELTKKFETFYKGRISDIINMKIPSKGEFVIVIRNA